MRIDCRYQRPAAVAYARATGPYEASSKAAWGQMLEWLDVLGLRDKVVRGIGFIRDNPSTTGAFLRRYDACVELIPGLDADLSAGIGRQMIAGGTYAIHTHVGAHGRIPEAFSQLHRTWLPMHGFAVDYERPFMEIYLTDPATTTAAGHRTELCVPVLPVAMDAFAGGAAGEHGQAIAANVLASGGRHR